MANEPYNRMVDILIGYDTDIHFSGDDIMTTTGIDFIEREMYKILITEPGDWKADPTIGGSPNRYIGEQNTREKAAELEAYIEQQLKLVVSPGIPKVRAVPTGESSLMLFVDVLIANFQRITIPFEFDYVNGIRKVKRLDAKVTPLKSSNHEINDISKLRRPNKYWSRMSYNAMNQV